MLHFTPHTYIYIYISADSIKPEDKKNAWIYKAKNPFEQCFEFIVWHRSYLIKQRSHQRANKGLWLHLWRACSCLPSLFTLNLQHKLDCKKCKQLAAIIENKAKFSQGVHGHLLQSVRTSVSFHVVFLQLEVYTTFSLWNTSYNV